MNNIANPILFAWAVILAIFGSVALTIIIRDKEPSWRPWRRRHRHKLKLQVYFINKIKHHLMSSINSITLTDNQPHSGLVTVVDDAGNSYTGTITPPVITVADPSQDIVTNDATTPNTVDVQEKNPTGGTTAILTADFTSQGNATPPAGSTKQAIPDGTVFPGLTCQIVMINKVTTQLKLQTTFP